MVGKWVSLLQVCLETTNIIHSVVHLEGNMLVILVVVWAFGGCGLQTCAQLLIKWANTIKTARF